MECLSFKPTCIFLKPSSFIFFVCLFFFFFFFSYLKGLAPRKKIKVKNEWFRSLFIYSKVKSFTKIGLKYESKISFSPTTTTAWYSWLSLSKLTLMLCLVVTCMGPFSTSPILSISCKSQSHSRLELLLFTIEHDIWTLEFRLHKPPSQKNNKIKISKLTNFFFFFSSHSLFVWLFKYKLSKKSALILSQFFFFFFLHQLFPRFNF